jgi:hypothetical protein
MHIRVHPSVRTLIMACLPTYIHTHIHTIYTHTYVLTHIHAFINACILVAHRRKHRCINAGWSKPNKPLMTPRRIATSTIKPTPIPAEAADASTPKVSLQATLLETRKHALVYQQPPTPANTSTSFLPPSVARKSATPVLKPRSATLKVIPGLLG